MSYPPRIYGIPNPYFLADGSQRTSSKPFLMHVAEGEIPGHIGVRKFGFCPDVDNVEITVWPGPAGLYTFPTTPMQMEVVSSDNTNDKAGGTGALTVMVHYLDGNFHEKSELVTLNGTTVVPTVATDIYRVNGFHVMTAGSTGKAAGNIDIRHLADTPVYRRILAGRTSCQCAIFTVPDATVDGAFITSWHVGIGAVAAGHYGIFRLMSTTNPMSLLTPGIFFVIDQVIIQDGSAGIPLEIPYKLVSGSDIMVTVISDGATANALATASFNLYTEPIGGI